MTNNVIKKVYKNGVEYQIYGSAGAAGAGDVTGPSSAADGHLAVFDGTTGKIIKDGGAVPSYSSSDFDIKDLADSTGLKTTWNNKQNALTTQTAYTTKGTGTKVATVSTNTLGQVTAITETSIDFPVTSVGGSTGAVGLKTINGTSLVGSGDLSVGGSYTAGNGIDITNDEIRLDGTYNGKDYSAMQGPCSDGFHVPLNTEWQAVYDIWTALGGGGTDGTNFGIALKLPFAGFRRNNNSNAEYQGTYGYYWSSSRSNDNNAYELYFYSTAINPQYNSSRALGFSVRCFKNSPTIPTSSWTKLYGTSIESGGIFWSSTDGLISLSSNGSNWITIQDKNLGATTVYNSGDTLSEANCGGYFQWGNNYMFPFTGTVTTSSTQVDASNYGPGNYYSSSTFITRGGSPYRWDTTDNGNLWGGVTGILTASGKLVVGDKLYKIVEAVAAPSGAGSNIITLVV